METLHLPFPGQGTTKLRRNSKVRPVACLVPWSFAKAQVPDAKCWISASWGTLGWDPGIQCCFGCVFLWFMLINSNNNNEY